MRICPCGTARKFAACCEPLLDGRPAPTAQALMRSRYTAFALGNADHVYRTWHPRTRPADIDLDSDVAWTGLRIIETSGGGQDDSVGTVSFEADWASAGQIGTLREISRFERRAGRWFYVDGEVGEA